MSRKVEFDADDEPKAKRPRLDYSVVVDDRQNGAPSLESVNDDCLVRILSYLPAEDLNTIAICSKRYRKARAHESLDQTRTGTIIIAEGTSLCDLLNASSESRWNQVFQGNRNHLVITGIEKLQYRREEWRVPHWPWRDAHEGYLKNDPRVPGARLPGVTRLDLQCSPPPARQFVQCHNLVPLVSLFPNIRELSLRNFTASEPCSVVWAWCLGPAKNQLARISWTGCEHQTQFVDCRVFEVNTQLSDICLDDCHFPMLFSKNQTEWQSFSNTAKDERYMFSRCRRLERLSIKNATYHYANHEALNQAVLVKMVRNHPTLRWLRSDLSPENIAILQQERPDMTFVSE